MLSFIAVVFLLAGLVKGMIGLGLPAISMGLLTIMISPFQAASLLIVPSMVTNIWQLCAEGHVFRVLQRFWSLLLGIIIGSVWSIFPRLGQSDFHSEALLGGMLLLYGLYGLVAKQIPNLSRYAVLLSPLMGYLGGALTVATGVVVIPVVPYLQSLHLQRDDLVQALGMVFTVSTVCLAIFLQQHPVDHLAVDYVWSFMALIPALLGMWLGTRIRYRIAEQKFRKIFFLGLIALGGYMLFSR